MSLYFVPSIAQHNEVPKRPSRGLTQAVLQAIRSDVYNVAAPIGP
jgi:hypothetical protein